MSNQTSPSHSLSQALSHFPDIDEVLLNHSTTGDDEQISDMYDIEFDFWLDRINASSMYDLIGSSWTNEAHRFLNIATQVIKRLDADLPLSATDKHRQKARQIREKFIVKIKQQFEVVETKLKNPLVTKQLDKVAFFLGVTNLWISALLIGMKPSWVPRWFTVKCIILISLRWSIYRRKHWHYFLADMCYLIIAVLLIFIHIFPYSRILFIILYTCTHGPLAWAIVTWRNSLVFHSLDKMTSVFIHLYPPITMAVMRWFDPNHSTAASIHFTGDYNYSSEHNNYFTLTEALVFATIAYGVWQIAYYILILHRRRHNVYNLGYATSFTWFIQEDGTLSRIISIFGKDYRLITFIALQYIYSMVTVIPTAYLSQSMVANIGFLVLMLSVSIWNASTFYIDVFSSRYARDLARLEGEFKSKLESLGKSPISTTTSSTVPSPSDLHYRSHVSTITDNNNDD